jgi:hypothetical protein
LPKALVIIDAKFEIFPSPIERLSDIASLYKSRPPEEVFNSREILTEKSDIIVGS